MWTPLLFQAASAVMGLLILPPDRSAMPLTGTWYCARGAVVSELYYSGTPEGSWLRLPGRRVAARVESDGGKMFVTPLGAGVGQLWLGHDPGRERLLGRWHLRAEREPVRCARTEDELGPTRMLPGVSPTNRWPI